jgi:hypothetical protein
MRTVKSERELSQLAAFPDRPIAADWDNPRSGSNSDTTNRAAGCRLKRAGYPFHPWINLGIFCQNGRRMVGFLLPVTVAMTLFSAGQEAVHLTRIRDFAANRFAGRPAGRWRANHCLNNQAKRRLLRREFNHE